MKRFILFTSFCLSLWLTMDPLNAEAKEPLSPLTIEAIRQSPEIYDGKKLDVAGRVRSLTPARGKRGSEFMVLVLEDSKSRPDDSYLIVTVFSYFTPPLRIGNRVIVKGIYHKEGYWAGSTHDHFIEASQIIPIEMN